MGIAHVIVESILASATVVSSAIAPVPVASPTPAVLPAVSPAPVTPAIVPRGVPDISPYAGLGSWLDIFEKAYRHPVATVAAMKSHGVATIFVETSNFSRPDIAYPGHLGALIDEAHAQGIKVEGWYLPSFKNLDKDLRKSMAAIEFTSPLGGHLDSFGLDIESGLVRSPATRSKRLIELSHDIRNRVGTGYPLDAITPIPVRLDQPGTYWPHFPYRELNKTYDVFVPMNYFSYDVSGEVAARKYTARGIRLIREGTHDPNVPIHVIGGIASGMSAGECRGFLDGARRAHAIGASLYNFSETGSEDWQVMEQL